LADLLMQCSEITPMGLSSRTADSFAELFPLAQAGDREAWAELVYKYRDDILAAAERRMRRLQIRGWVDIDFVVELTLSEAALDFTIFKGQTPQDIAASLHARLKNTLANERRKLEAAKRDVRRLVSLDHLAPNHERSNPSLTDEKARLPEELVLDRELWNLYVKAIDVMKQTHPALARILRSRSKGHSWRKIAENTGASNRTIQKMYRQAVPELLNIFNVLKKRTKDSPP
jgi:hypothetical protein